MVRTVATYTTIPDRYDILYESLLSLQKQTVPPDTIYLTVPKYSVRFKKPYPPIPQNISDLCQVIYIETDYGPITKLYGGLNLESDPNTLIISCDDDVIFPPTYIEIMVKHHNENPDIVIAGSGALLGAGIVFLSAYRSVEQITLPNGLISFNIGPTGRKVDLIFGISGVGYPRKVFPVVQELYSELLQYSLRHHSIFLNDNILISGYLCKHHIDRKVFKDIPIVDHVYRKDNLTSDLPDIISRLNGTILRIKEYGFFPYTEPVVINETFAWRLFIFGLILFVIIIFSIYLYTLI